MALWGVVFLAVLAGVTAEPLAVFPESVNGRLGSRIVSGWEAEEGQFPYQLSLRMVNPVGQVNACGGSIIHEEWGLTAAHCTATRVTMVVRAGAVNLTGPVYLFETTEYYNHPSYIDSLQSVVQPNDIALLKFNRALTWNDRVKPIRIQSSQDMNKDYSGIRLVASGWGLTWTNGASSENLNWVYLNGVSNEFCKSSYQNSPIIVDSTICAAYYNVTSQSPCQGDSGGLLTVIDKDGELTQIGVTSFVSGQGCHSVIPAGFIRPGHYHDWIEEVTGINFDWDNDSSEESSSSESSSSESSSSESSSSQSTSEESSEENTTTDPEKPTTPESEEEKETSAPEEATTTPVPEESEETTENSEEEDLSTTAAPEDLSTTAAPEVEGPSTTAAPEEEDLSTAATPEVEDLSTTATPEVEDLSTTATPEVEDLSTTAAPEDLSTTAAPEVEDPSTTAAPEEEEDLSTTAAPEVEDLSTTAAPEVEDLSTTAAPEEEEEEGSFTIPTEPAKEDGEAGNSFLKSYFSYWF